MTWNKSREQEKRYHAMLRSFARSMVLEAHDGVIPACLDSDDPKHKCKACRRFKNEVDKIQAALHMTCRFSFLGIRDADGFFTDVKSTTGLTWHEYSDYYMKCQGALCRKYPQHYHDAPDDKKWG